MNETEIQPSVMEKVEEAKDEIPIIEEVDDTKLEKALRAAIKSKDIKALQNALDQAQSIEHKGKLDGEIADAQRLLEKLKRIEVLQHSMSNLHVQGAISEIKSFSRPPEAVISVMQGVVLLLGNDKSEKKDWRSIVKLMSKFGKDSLKRRVNEFNVKELKPEVAKEAKTILNKYSQEKVQSASTGAAALHRWGTAMIELSELE